MKIAIFGAVIVLGCQIYAGAVDKMACVVLCLGGNTDFQVGQEECLQMCEEFGVHWFAKKISDMGGNDTAIKRLKACAENYESVYKLASATLKCVAKASKGADKVKAAIAGKEKIINVLRQKLKDANCDAPGASAANSAAGTTGSSCGEAGDAPPKKVSTCTKCALSDGKDKIAYVIALDRCRLRTSGLVLMYDSLDAALQELQGVSDADKKSLNLSIMISKH